MPTFRLNTLLTVLVDEELSNHNEFTRRSRWAPKFEVYAELKAERVTEPIVGDQRSHLLREMATVRRDGRLQLNQRLQASDGRLWTINTMREHPKSGPEYLELGITECEHDVR